jgi:hypothetical protein
MACQTFYWQTLTGNFSVGSLVTYFNMAPQIFLINLVRPNLRCHVKFIGRAIVKFDGCQYIYWGTFIMRSKEQPSGRAIVIFDGCQYIYWGTFIMRSKEPPSAGQGNFRNARLRPPTLRDMLPPMQNPSSCDLGAIIMMLV